MLRKITAVLVIVAGLWIILPGEDGGNAPEQDRPEAQRELVMKQQLMAADISRTNVLCRTQCKHDLRMLASNGQLQPSRYKAFLSEHPHIVQVHELDRSGNSSPHGEELPAVQHAPASRYMQKAKEKALRGEVYESPTFEADGTPYFILAMPVDAATKAKPGHKASMSAADDEPQALVAVVKQQLLKEVEVHQKKNLRIVPYPSDKRFRVESVDFDTGEDVRVDHPEENEGTSHYYVNQVVVRFVEPLSEEDAALLERELDLASAEKLGYAYVLTSNSLTTQEMMAYLEQWSTVYMEPHYLYLTNGRPDAEPYTQRNQEAAIGGRTEMFSETAPNDALYDPYQWNLPTIETLEGWKYSKGNEEVTVAVIDTGVDLTHPDLAGQLLHGMNLVDEQTEPNDDVGHGTHVAGVISALTDNYEGIAGMTWYNKVLPVKVLDASGAGSTYDVARGIIWATDQGAKVINMSLGNYADAEFLHDAVRYAYDRDVVLIAATGNDNTEQPGYPAAYPEVFAVSATDPYNRRAFFSNYGDYVDVVAPGENIASTYMQNQYAALSGTSMASPHVAALAALIRSVNPLLSNAEVMDLMRETAIDLGAEGKDKEYGYGLIDVNTALERASQAKSSILYWSKWLGKASLRGNEAR
ncbi:peptidase S8 [Xylanibacillus composti]|uniref:S8 family serine peptidase n=1 Tax=Xylanibacillus composti TaxID=1572762 RepID=A0A8J4M0Z9_9BACL|nr:S8 family peptidase [Xylanibacillus composti]MDT9724403.1 peptidase S8 [Xylanibacillus composti]GIQ67999.1 S8 family serine peptidase [Xylanibacillus composti]